MVSRVSNKQKDNMERSCQFNNEFFQELSSNKTEKASDNKEESDNKEGSDNKEEIIKINIQMEEIAGDGDEDINKDNLFKQKEYQSLVDCLIN